MAGASCFCAGGRHCHRCCGPLPSVRATSSGRQFVPPEPLGLYLGCNQHPMTISQQEVDKRFENIRPLFPRDGSSAPRADGLSAGNTEVFIGEPSPGKATPSKCGIKGLRYEMENFCDQCVDSYCELAGVDRKSVTPAKPLLFPGIDDHQLKEENFEIAGNLGGALLQK